MIQGKQLTIAIAVCAAFFSGNALAFDKDFHPNHKIIDRESIGPNFKSDLIIDKEKAAKEKNSRRRHEITFWSEPTQSFWIKSK